ncbi:abscisic acid receptor PYL12-like [Chenopodium quinoa]|uniref:abscisic acid receptor PYL12-like n=1 Tax=Chenopodium quinoa TaxID=63459 RepID=UPI000B777D5B|nr:abscisic acid receptor PYL12-like [Chenopodium quinoa]
MVSQVQSRRCGSQILQTINAPLLVVWSLIRQFDWPHVFKKLVQTCTLVSGAGEVGSVRQVFFGSGLPGKTSIERLERMDEEQHINVYRVIDGDHKLVTFHVTTSLHEVVENGNGNKTTLVVESYTVDVPNDSNEKDTCLFANTIIELNLKNLAIVVEKMVCGKKVDQDFKREIPLDSLWQM